MTGARRGQGEPPETIPHRTLSKSLELLSSRVSEAGDKLWFIKRTLRDFERRPPGVRRIPILRGILFHYDALTALGELARDPRAGEIRLPRLPVVAFHRLRHVALAVTLVGVGLVLARAGVAGYAKAREGADWAFEQLMPAPAVASVAPAAARANLYPDQRLGPVPTGLWLVERKADEELWSNGLRIVTTFATNGRPRSFFAFPRDGSPPVPLGPDPVGIVYHTTESDMAPLAPRFSRDIVETTRDLMGWLSRRRIYHYVIDRFGQVYRIVDDAGVAVHAGDSIWGDDRRLYLNLNDGFLGVAFESQSRGGDGAITPAQLQAALNLTDVLRSRHAIADANCVPHGLVSVNRGRHLIGYHTDWARDFPFAALGLTNKYETPPPSMTAFGFLYDGSLVQRLGGKLWPGIEKAERELEEKARGQGVTLPVLRTRLRRVYRENLELLRN